jgi:hypothetical protein
MKSSMFYPAGTGVRLLLWAAALLFVALLLTVCSRFERSRARTRSGDQESWKARSSAAPGSGDTGADTVRGGVLNRAFYAGRAGEK